MWFAVVCTFFLLKGVGAEAAGKAEGEGHGAELGQGAGAGGSGGVRALRCAPRLHCEPCPNIAFF